MKKQQTNRQFFFLLSDDDENQWFVVITPFSIKIDHYFLSSLQTKLLHNKFLDSLIVNNNGISTTTTKRMKKTTHHPNRISIARFWIDVVVVYFYFFYYTLLHKRNERKNEKTIIIEKTLIIENPLISIKQQWMSEWEREREKNGYPPSYSADVFGLLLFVCLILDFFSLLIQSLFHQTNIITFSRSSCLPKTKTEFIFDAQLFIKNICLSWFLPILIFEKKDLIFSPNFHPSIMMMFEWQLWHTKLCMCVCDNCDL